MRFYARGHLGTLLGVAVAAAILVGALAVGDCVRVSLHDLALARIGRATFALASRDRFFRSALADGLPGAAAVLQLPGTAATPDQSARANHVQILGVNEKFWALAQTPLVPRFAPDSVLLNAALAAQLRAKAGDTIILRAQKPSLLSLEAPDLPAPGCFDGHAADSRRRGFGRAVWTLRLAGQSGLAAERLPALVLFAGDGRPAGPGQSASDRRAGAGLETTLDPGRRRPGMARHARRLGIAHRPRFH